MDHSQIQVSVPCLVLKSSGKLAMRDLSLDLSEGCDGLSWDGRNHGGRVLHAHTSLLESIASIA
jgi:hypothetical protein